MNLFRRFERLRTSIQQNKVVKAHRKQIAKNSKRITELDLLFRKTYEDNATGKLSDERFEQLSSGYESEQRELKLQSESMQSEVDSYEADGAKVDKFISLVNKYTSFPELTPGIINEFVGRILVHAPDKSSGKRTQRVDIYLNFIGNFEIPVYDEPMPEPTA